MFGCMQELGGRPRVDVLCNMSGIFRDSFQNVVELLDDLFKRAAQASEPADSNFIRCSNTVTPCQTRLKRVLCRCSNNSPIQIVTVTVDTYC